MSNFVHLHNHTEYSLLDGAIRVPRLIDRAKEYDQEAVAITDHGVLYGMIKFYRQAREEDIKPIIGCEVYVTPENYQEKVETKLYHLILLAADNRGYENLLKIVSKSHLEGFYYKPRVDKDLLYRFREGLIATSSCLQGEISSLVLDNKKESAIESAREYRQIFGRENYYIELQDHKLPQEKEVNPELIEIARNNNIGLIASNDCHYSSREDAEFHDVLLALQTNSNLDDDDRMQMPNDEFYLKSPAEMERIFSGIPEALKNTNVIADRCNVELEFDQFFLPDYPEAKEKNVSPEEMLRELCEQALARNFPEDDEAKKRMEYELNVICDMGYAAYFLIVQDFVKEAQQRGIRVGPGRGSAAGSFVSYLLGITKVNPLDYGLIFERFLNPDRVSLPDIDIDFDERRDEIIDYVSTRYGQERVAQIGTFGTMAARGAVRDVGRVLGMDYDKVDTVAKAIPLQQSQSLAEARENISKLKELAENDEEIKELLDKAEQVEGLPRHISTHAAGVIIGPRPLIELTPLQMQDDTRITQLPMEDVEALGLLKMDFLGLRNLTVIEDALNKIAANHNRKIDIDSVPLDEKEVYEMLSAGKTAGVFQMESQLFQDLTSRLKPDRFSDIIALLALGRPGPLGSGLVDDYIKCRHGEKEPEYLHPDLKPILQETFGLILYQEQVMEIASELGNFSMGEADILRRGMGKKKEELVASERERFVKGARENNISRDTAHAIFDQMEYFAGYGFNKSHSAAYALLAYQTAYLKAKYPAEFMAALLSSVMSNLDKVSQYISSARTMGLDILSPDINESNYGFTCISGEKIRFGLKAIKHLGSKAIEEIVSRREKEGRFPGFYEFLDSSDLSALQKSDVEALIKAGACDGFSLNRAQMHASLDELYERLAQNKAREAEGQTSFFDLVDEDDNFYSDEFTFPDLDPLGQQERLNQEREYLGLYLSGHPLDPYREFFREIGADSFPELKQRDGEKSKVIWGGLVTDYREHITRNERKMAFLTVENHREMDVVVFPSAFEGSVRLIDSRQAVIIYGELEEDQIIAERVIPLSEGAVIVDFLASSEAKLRKEFLELLQVNSEGRIPVFARREEREISFLWLPPEKTWLNSITPLKNLEEIRGDYI